MLAFIRGFILCRIKHMLIPEVLSDYTRGPVHSKCSKVEILSLCDGMTDFPHKIPETISI